MKPHERLIGIETMRSRIEAFHAARLERIGATWKMDAFRTSGWSAAKVIREYREIPEGMEWEKMNSADAYNPTNPPAPKTDAQMAAIISANGLAALL